ncbi:hypothetical protein B0H10DRAFT_2247641 [Mycena sp. CBHHK59/15]|nr:hypothetical protein B0H10DRAFT_2247641 [Mycena sp. CBHHK59/15]
MPSVYVPSDFSPSRPQMIQNICTPNNEWRRASVSLVFALLHCFEILNAVRVRSVEQSFLINGLVVSHIRVEKIAQMAFDFRRSKPIAPILIELRTTDQVLGAQIVTPRGVRRSKLRSCAKEKHGFRLENKTVPKTTGKTKKTTASSKLTLKDKSRVTVTARVTQSTFSPASTRLANTGRRAVRVKIATDSGFPIDHAEFTWTAVSDAVTSSAVPELVESLTLAEKSEERKAQLLTYAWGGAPQLRGEVKTLCKNAHITWLTGKKGIFKYGNIDLTAQTYDVQQPYGHPFYKSVMTKQWFDTAKSEGVRTSSYCAFVDSPLNLVTNGMLNALKEWATGVRIQIKFTEEEFGPRYDSSQLFLPLFNTPGMCFEAHHWSISRREGGIGSDKESA